MIQTLLGNAREMETSRQRKSSPYELKEIQMQHSIVKRLYECLWNKHLLPLHTENWYLKNVQNLKGIVKYFSTL